MRKMATLIFLFIATLASAAPPILIDQKTGRYLGNLSTNHNDPDSVSNPHGRYGSKESEDISTIRMESMEALKVMIV